MKEQCIRVSTNILVPGPMSEHAYVGEGELLARERALAGQPDRFQLKNFHACPKSIICIIHGLLEAQLVQEGESSRQRIEES